MRRILGTMLVGVLFSAFVGSVRADEAEANAILDKAIKALGGEEKLGKVEAATWKSKATLSINGNDNEFTSQSTIQGLGHYRSEFEGDFNGNKFKGVVILNGEKGWRKFGDMDTMEMDKDAVDNEKRMVSLQLVPMLILPLKKEKGFKVETAGEESVGDAPAAVLKVTGPGGKTFKLFFNKESGLPVKLVAPGVMGFMGEEFTMETTYSAYKEFDGIKKATKIESKRDGEKFQSQEINDFKVLDKAPDDAFNEPK